MTTDAPWDSTRWRDVQYSGPPRAAYDSGRQSQGPHPPAPQTQPHSAIPSPYGHNSPHWDSRRINTEHRTSGQSVATDHSTDASNFQSRPQERHSPSSSVNYSSLPAKEPFLLNSLPGWRNNIHRHSSSTTDSTEPPPPMQLPRAQDLPRISPPYSALQHEHQQHRTSAPSSTLLPSFASFQDQANRSDDTDEGPEIAPMSERLPCHSCTKLQPMMREIAIAMAELDENVQSACHRPGARSLDFPNENPVRAAQWVLDRLRIAKYDLQELSRKGRSDAYYQGAQYGANSRPMSPANALKRPGEAWEREDKRPRTGDSHEPSSPGRRPLPSPSSMIYPHGNGQSTSSPTTGGPQGAHIADLQHQITLKSLALQSLQSEYGSLLQKLQREKVKNQGIEKKSSATSIELHELATKNEELTEQVKALESQLEDSEKKREVDTAGAARDKAQWSRMLDMSGRLQARQAEERQKLTEERDALLKRVSAVEEDNATRAAHLRETHGSANPQTQGQTEQVLDLKREIEQLKKRNDALRQALDDMLRQQQSLNDRTRDLLLGNDNAPAVPQPAAVYTSPAPAQHAAPTSSEQTRSPPPSLPSLASTFPTARSPTHESPAQTWSPAHQHQNPALAAMTRDSLHAYPSPAPREGGSMSPTSPSSRKDSGREKIEQSPVNAAMPPPAGARAPLPGWHALNHAQSPIAGSGP